MQGSLATQSLENFDASKLTPLSPEVISRQATINIGTIGHVAHGKTTVVQALSGKDTRQHSKERVRNITIKLGYANCKIYQCPNCPPPQCYQSRNSSFPDQAPCNICQAPMVLQRHISFVDCPGHDILMATMLNGAAVMDACLLIIAGNEPCPQPQTSEHMAAVDIMQLKKILILQNKLDLVQANTAKDQEKEIKKFVEGTQAANAPIIPIVAVQKYNMDVLCQYICSFVDIPLRDFTSSPKLIIIRSFDVNKPGCTINDLKGGVAGGSLLHGVLKIGDEVEIRPGISDRNAQGQIQCTPILSRIVSLHAEDNDLKFAVPGGLIGVGLQIDPSITRNDNLVGHVLGHPGQLPDIYTEIQVTYYLLRRLLGVKSEQGKSSSTKVQKLKKNEILMVNVGSTTTGGKVMALKGDTQTKLELVNPVCCTVGEKVTLSRKVLNHWRLIGWGTIDKGVVLQIN